MKKLALISNTVPPAPNGQALMIEQLFKKIDSKDYCFISRQFYSYSDLEKNPKKLGCKYYFIKPLISIKKSSNILLKAMSLFFSLFEIISVSKDIKNILVKEQASSVVACSGNLVDLPAAWIASKRLKLEFYPYFFDHYKYQQKLKILRVFNGFFEKRIVKTSKNIIVPNEKTSELYKKEYGKGGIIIRNPCDLSKYHKTDNRTINSKDKIKIIYTGDIYSAQIDAFQNLVSALDVLDSKKMNISLDIYATIQSKNFFEKNIKTKYKKIKFHNHINHSNIPKTQMSADLLFLPLSFNSSYPPELINTSAPGKTGEYLASGRPILVHAPKGSFLSWYFRKHRCGAVVDVYDSEKLASTLENLISDTKLQKEYIKNARIRAKEDFDLKKIREMFIKIFK